MDGKTVIQEPRKRIMVRRIIESAPYIMYRYAEDFGIMDDFIPAISGFTSMRETARRIVELAAMDMFGSTGSIEMHTGIRDGTVKENRDLIDFIGSDNPHIAAVLQRSISKRIVKEFGSSGIVYDLSAIRYYGKNNDLAEYGHYYHSNGENMEINFVMAGMKSSIIPKSSAYLYIMYGADSMILLTILHVVPGALYARGLLQEIRIYGERTGD